MLKSNNRQFNLWSKFITANYNIILWVGERLDKVILNVFWNISVWNTIYLQGELFGESNLEVRKMLQR